MPTALSSGSAQKKKDEEEARKKEMAELFAASIKQPKVPLGAECNHISGCRGQSCPPSWTRWGRRRFVGLQLRFFSRRFGYVLNSAILFSGRSGSEEHCLRVLQEGSLSKGDARISQHAKTAARLPIWFSSVSNRCVSQGFKCKFAHDLAVERKTQKIDVFSDKCVGSQTRGPLFPAFTPPAGPIRMSKLTAFAPGREGQGQSRASDAQGRPSSHNHTFADALSRRPCTPPPYCRRDNETMENWDQEQLEAAILEKETGNVNRPTDIICKHFLDAIEKKQYGWFWTCPNGGNDCKYRHALPPGYVMKSQLKALAAEEAANRRTIEDEIEEARSKIEGATPVTEAVFREWKRRKARARASPRESCSARVDGGLREGCCHTGGR